jgi:hypothetical protein
MSVCLPSRRRLNVIMKHMTGVLYKNYINKSERNTIINLVNELADHKLSNKLNIINFDNLYKANTDYVNKILLHRLYEYKSNKTNINNAFAEQYISNLFCHDLLPMFNLIFSKCEHTRMNFVSQIDYITDNKYYTKLSKYLLCLIISKLD